MNTKSIIFAGGGTAGHVNPLLATAKKIRSIAPDAKIRVLGTSEGIEQRLIPEAGFELDFIPRAPLPRSLNMNAIKFPVRFLSGIIKCKRIFEEHRPAVLVGFGGFVSTPAYIAARQAHIPIIMHEQNASAGLANKLAAGWADCIAITFPNTTLPHVEKQVLLGLPLREEIEDLANVVTDEKKRLELKRDALKHFNLNPNKPTLLITGGSQGAVIINKIVAVAAKKLTEEAQVIHLTGVGKSDSVLAELAKNGVDLAKYKVFEYLDSVQKAFIAADLAVSRSGAGAVSEMSALLLPAAYIPFIVGNGEQKLNLAESESVGGSFSLDQHNLSPKWFLETVLPLMKNADELAKMRDGLRKIQRVNAADEFAKLILERVNG
ncbi:MAG: undecaprenyldiphospho-muramoylpentapeptide beta-N-acetylglucosaminyltransferase [Bifidobacteriaceae bacterium]|nr:undecaprenyldiphospho-muramoylpentapeptide beta-N-acetylglucosaminyltransferase [Bifidobacteriaceae bacterium]